MSLADFLFGRPLKLSEERRERVGPAAGIAIFGLDALGSAAYGPEAALTLLMPLGAAALAYIVPISASIIILLLIARQNLGVFPGRHRIRAAAGRIGFNGLTIRKVDC